MKTNKVGRPEGLPKTGGRTKGTPNKITKEVRETIQEILDNELKEIPTLLATLEPKDRLYFLTRLLPFVIPKLKPDIPELVNQRVVINFNDDFDDGFVGGMNYVKKVESPNK